jgi:Fe-S-cluster containining protein
MKPDDAIVGLPQDDARLTRSEVEGGLRFALHEIASAAERITELEGKVAALTGALLAAAAVTPEDLEERARKAAPASRESQIELHRGPSKYSLPKLDIDCAALMPICKAACCSYLVYLSEQDLDERILSWDYRTPYQLPQQENGYCRYCDPRTYRCQVYVHRPATCRTFDCRRDSRIWKDFERRIPA